MFSCVVAFVGETFWTDGNYCYSKPTSIAFLQDVLGVENVIGCSPLTFERKIDAYSSRISVDKFSGFPQYLSTQQFVLRCVANPSYYLSYVRKADEVICKYPEAIFWVRTPSIGSILFALRVIRHGKPLLHHMCADASETWRDAKYKGISKIAAWCFSKILVSKLKKICEAPKVINLCTGDRLESFSRHLAPSNTHQFVDLMVKRSPDVNSKVLDGTQTRELLFIGRVVEDKGIFDLIHSVSQLESNVHLTVVGDGPDLERAKDYASKLFTGGRVSFAGQVPHEELGEYLQQSHLVVVPSNNHYEGFPRVIMEAWNYGLPVIVSEVGGIKAFVKHGENGLIFQPGDREGLLIAIKKALNVDYYDVLLAGVLKCKNISTQEYWGSLVRSAAGWNN